MILNLRGINVFEHVIWLVKCKRQVLLCEGGVGNLLDLPVAGYWFHHVIRTMDN